jgi:hypothetical protein
MPKTIINKPSSQLTVLEEDPESHDLILRKSYRTIFADLIAHKTANNYTDQHIKFHIAAHGEDYISIDLNNDTQVIFVYPDQISMVLPDDSIKSHNSKKTPSDTARLVQSFMDRLNLIKGRYK